ncbi:MAG: hydrogenase maturation protease [Candidatus Aminicenantia bacterium]
MKKDILVLALGNDILKDDGVGLYAGRELKSKFDGKVDIVESAESGLALLDYIVGYKKVLILDSIKREEREPGKIVYIRVEELEMSPSPSPHYVGLPMSLEIGKRLGFNLPEEIRILAMEVEDPYTLGEGLTERVALSFPSFVKEAEDILREWIG